MARWTRAIKLLPPRTRRVLDLGCAFGFATRRLARSYDAVGVDASPPYIQRAVRSRRGARYALALAGRVPLRDGSFDAVLLLDVIEHVPDEREVLREAHRVLRPGGVLILSVPHTGLLRAYDSINRCPKLVDPAEIAPFRDLARESGEIHRHYSLHDLRALLGPGYRVDRVQYTGVGVAEFVNIVLLWLTKRLLRMPRLYDVLQYIYFTVYLAEDMIPFGPWSYHIMIRARRTEFGT
jgi:SAM-dependent methyltransferase